MKMNDKPLFVTLENGQRLAAAEVSVALASLHDLKQEIPAAFDTLMDYAHGRIDVEKLEPASETRQSLANGEAPQKANARRMIEKLRVHPRPTNDVFTPEGQRRTFNWSGQEAAKVESSAVVSCPSLE